MIKLVIAESQTANLPLSQGDADSIAIHLSSLGWDENAIRAHYEMNPPFVEIRHIISNLGRYEAPKEAEPVSSEELFVDAESMSAREQRYQDYKAAKKIGKKAMYFRDTDEDPDAIDFAKVAPITVFERDDGLLEVADGMHRVFLAKKSNAFLPAWVIRLKRDSLHEQGPSLKSEKSTRKLIREMIKEAISFEEYYEGGPGFDLNYRCNYTSYGYIAPSGEVYNLYEHGIPDHMESQFVPEHRGLNYIVVTNASCFQFDNFPFEDITVNHLKGIINVLLSCSGFVKNLRENPFDFSIEISCQRFYDEKRRTWDYKRLSHFKVIDLFDLVKENNVEQIREIESLEEYYYKSLGA